MKRKIISRIISIGLVFLVIGVIFGYFPSTANAAATIYVPDDYPTIQSAIDAASPGDIVIVASGNYTENVEVNKSITLQGQGMSVVDASGNGSAISVTADNCTIEGFKVTGADSPWDAGIEVLSDNNTLSNNICYDNSWAGIYLVGSNGNTLRNNNMYGNHFNFAIINGYIHDIDTSNTVEGKPVYYLVNEDSILIDSSTNAGFVAAVNSTNITVKDLTFSHNRQGVLFANTQDSRIENVNVSGGHENLMLTESTSNLIIGCNTSDSQKFGILLDTSENNTIRGNAVSNNPLGIAVSHSTGNNIENNLLSSSCLYLTYSSNNTIAQNSISLSSDCGLILKDSSNNTILNNTVAENMNFGIEITYSSNENVILGNNVRLNEKGIWLHQQGGESPSGNIIFHNNLINNNQNAYDDIGTNFWDNGSQGNHWSDYTGLDVNGDGIGDTPYEIPGDAGARDNFPLMSVFLPGDANISLGEGWNLFATPFPLESGYSTWGELKAVSGGLNANIAYYYDPDYTVGGVHLPWRAVTDSYQITPGDAIYVHMSAADTVSLVASTAPSVPSKALSAGWNLIGLGLYPGPTMPVDQALTSAYTVTGDLSGYVQVISPALNQTGWVYLRGFDAAGKDMSIGQGYWVFMVNPGMLAGFTTTPLP